MTRVGDQYKRDNQHPRLSALSAIHEFIVTQKDAQIRTMELELQSLRLKVQLLESLRSPD